MFESILQWDKDFFLALNFNGGEWLDRFFWIVSGKLTWAPLYLLIVFLLWRRYGWRQTLIAMIFIAVTVVAVDQVCNILKETIGKLRPTHNPDFEGLINLIKRPSGTYYRGAPYGSVSAHAATTFAIMTLTSSLIRAHWFSIMMIIWVLLVSYSRIYIGAHYPLDIIGGGLLGIVSGVMMVRLYRWTICKIEEKKKSFGDS